MGFPREESGQVDEDGDGRLDAAEGLPNGLPVIADRLQLTHCSIIRSDNFGTNGLHALGGAAGRRRTDGDSPARSVAPGGWLPARRGAPPPLTVRCTSAVSRPGRRKGTRAA